VAEAFGEQFGDNSHEAAPAGASEDFSVFGRTWNVPYVFWFVGGTDPALYERALRDKKLNAIPSNHSPKFAPVLNPTLATGLQAMLDRSFRMALSGSYALIRVERLPSGHEVLQATLVGLNDHRLFTFLDLAGTFAFAVRGAVAARGTTASTGLASS
jgi:hypothetical protein